MSWLVRMACDSHYASRRRLFRMCLASVSSAFRTMYQSYQLRRMAAMGEHSFEKQLSSYSGVAVFKRTIFSCRVFYLCNKFSRFSGRRIIPTGNNAGTMHCNLLPSARFSFVHNCQSGATERLFADCKFGRCFPCICSAFVNIRRCCCLGISSSTRVRTCVIAELLCPQQPWPVFRRCESMAFTHASIF